MPDVSEFQPLPCYAISLLFHYFASCRAMPAYCRFLSPHAIDIFAATMRVRTRQQRTGAAEALRVRNQHMR